MKARTAAGVTLLLQTVALGFLTLFQVQALSHEIHDAGQPGASNYMPTLLISAGFTLALVVATLVSLTVVLRDRLDVALLVRTEFGVMGLMAVIAVATGFAVSLAMLVAFAAAVVVATLALRTRLA